MLVQRIGLGFIFMHVVYLSAFPVLREDEKKTPGTLTDCSKDETNIFSKSEAPEPWEVNQDLINHQGVHRFGVVYSGSVFISQCFAIDPLICRLSPTIINRNSKSLADRVKTTM